ncbi:MAG: glycosyltransferase family 4 protein [Chloroflexi bacterium]|nr:glycosyltransferase family 4 protein [Chloroflexota bacterium]
MKVLTVAATDRLGGAGIAAYRTHRALRDAGVEAQMLVWRKTTSDRTVHRLATRFNLWARARRKLAARRHQGLLKSHPRIGGSAYWSLNLFNYPIAPVINGFDADIVHLHWLGDNFMPIQQLASIEQPLVWTLHDMWAFTGGCHYAGECMRFLETCGNCPQLAEPGRDDISARVNRQKRSAWAQVPLTLVCPSGWLARCAGQSAVMRDKRIEVIPNPIDTAAFKPLDRREARYAFNLPLDKKLVLFGAVDGTADPRKGFAYLREALSAFAESDGVELVIFGADNEDNGGSIDLDVPMHRIGILRDNVSLNLLYSACDVFVLPALQDNLPNTLLEALACGTPCVAFDTGGIGDLLQHQENGYLAQLADAEDLRQGIEWSLAQEWWPERIHQRVAERYAAERISEQYIGLYQSILGGLS